MTSVWFITPAWLRYELTAVCLEQRQRVIAELAARGIEGRCVVVADDENLDTARALGFDTVERDNEWLGRRFNDGMQYAGRHGAEWIVPIGSDSWIDPAYFLPLPLAGETRTSSAYCAVEPNRLAEVRVRNGTGAGPYTFHRSLLEPSGFRPAQDQIKRHVDSSTVAGITASAGPVAWRFRELHPFQYVGFRQPPLLTPYDKLWRRWGVQEHADPWGVLETIYPADLVGRVRSVLSIGERVAA